MTGDKVNFFISHAGTDEGWVAWQLAEAGYTIELDVWDWSAGLNFVTAMSDALDRCDRVVALFSAAYFDRSRYASQEWPASLLHESGITQGRLIPLRVEDVPSADVPALLRPLSFRDLFGLEEEDARRVLLEAVARSRRPNHPPMFPGGRPGAQTRLGKPSPRLPGSMPSVWNIPDRNPGFTGREQLLATARERLLAGEKTAIQALHGIGGVGKTQLAAEYAHRFAKSYSLAWWVTAEQPALIGAQFAALAIELGCAEEGTQAEEVRVAVLRRLRQQDGWLLVFDSAEGPDALKGWLPGGGGHVLITSRASRWAEIATPLEIDVLRRSESVVMLCDRVSGLAEADAEQLAEQLGDLPLGLAQAAGYMAETGRTATRYLSLLKTRAREVLDQGQPLTYPHSLAAATQLTADQLAEDTAAAELANLCAFLAPEPIPEDLLTNAVEELPGALTARVADPLAWDQTLAQVTRRALARVDQRGVQMHRLTQAILRDRLTPEQAAAVRARAESILAVSDPGNPADPANWPAWARLMPHLLASNLSTTGNSRLRATAGNVCRYLLAHGEVHSGHALARELYESWRVRLGDDDPDALTMASNLGWALGNLGDHAAARAVEEDTLARRSRVLGEDHPDTLSSAQNLAATLSALGELRKARTLGEDTLPRLRLIRGADHLNTLACAINLTSTLSSLGLMREAQILGEDTERRLRHVLGEDHPLTHVTTSNLAVILRELGDTQEAVELGEDALRQLRRVLGEDHPDTLTAAADLAVTLRELGNRRAALDLDMDTLARRRRVLGDDHPSTKAAADSLAIDVLALSEEEDDA